MPERPSESASGRMERLRAQWRDRKERRTWRRERRKGAMNLYDSTNQAESSMYKGGFFKKD